MNIEACSGVGQRESSLKRDRARVEKESEFMISFSSKKRKFILSKLILCPCLQ